jgi:hypothetical protein
MVIDTIFTWKMPWKTSLSTLYLSRYSEGMCPEPMRANDSLAEDANLEMVYRRSFHEIYQDEKDDEEFGRLMDRMGVKDEDGVRGIKGEEWEASGLYLAFAFEKRGGY